MVKIFRPPTLDPNDHRFAFRNGDSGPFEFNDRGACWFEDEIPEGWLEMIPQWKPGTVWQPVNRPVGNPGTHRSHCCMRHGCKYSSLECPVVLGQLEQDHPCEACDDDDDEEWPHA
jgi:hypothetical protein